MSYSTSLPFERGKTFLDGVTLDSEHYAAAGQEYEVNDTTYNRMVTLRLVRNTSTVTVYQHTLAILNALGTEIVGIQSSDYEQRVAPIDDLPSTGCIDDDWCYVVVKGPAICLTQIAVIADNVIAAGAEVRGTTINATTLVAATVGRIQARELTSSVTVASQEQLGVFGRAISAAATSGNTATDLLVDVRVAF